MSDDEARSESRSSEQIGQHYLIEKELAARLRTATKEERRDLYTEVYDELFRRVPDHPQLALKLDEGRSAVASSPLHIWFDRVAVEDLRQITNSQSSQSGNPGLPVATALRLS